MFNEKSRYAFRRKLSLDNATWARGRGWALWKALCWAFPGSNRIDKRVVDEVLADYTRELKMFPQIVVNVRTVSNVDWTTKPDVVAAVAAAEKTLSGRGRVLLRASGTEPVIRVMVEGEDRAEVDGLANGIADLLQAAV